MASPPTKLRGPRRRLPLVACALAASIGALAPTAVPSVAEARPCAGSFGIGGRPGGDYYHSIRATRTGCRRARRVVRRFARRYRRHRFERRSVPALGYRCRARVTARGARGRAPTRVKVRCKRAGGRRVVRAVGSKRGAGAPEAPPPDMSVAFFDDFAGNRLDSGRWFVHDHPAEVNDELQYYTPRNVAVSGSKLAITAREESFRGADYTSGLITTAGRFSFLYGKVEIRLKAPGGAGVGKGLWPSLFMLEDEAAPFFGGSSSGEPGGTQLTGGWPTTGFSEVDVWEFRGSEPFGHHSARHWGATRNKPVPDISDDYEAAFDETDGFHTYGFVWTPDNIAWEVDGVEWLRFTSEDTEIPSVPMFLIVNFAVGGVFDGNPNGDTAFPVDYEVDWIRVTQPNAVSGGR